MKAEILDLAAGADLYDSGISQFYVRAKEVMVEMIILECLAW